MNYEIDTYVEAQKRLPSREIQLETLDNTYYYFKADILSGMITYSTDKNFAANAVSIPSKRVFDIIRMNRDGQKPETLLDESMKRDVPPKALDLAEQDSLTRFDKQKSNKNSRNNNRRRSNEEFSDRPRRFKSDVRSEGEPRRGNNDRPHSNPRSAEATNRNDRRPNADRPRRQDRPSQPIMPKE